MMSSPRAGMIAAVVRSDRCQRMPVKYSNVDPIRRRALPLLLDHRGLQLDDA